MGKWGNGEMGKWGNGEMGKWGNGEMGKISNFGFRIPDFEKKISYQSYD